MVKDSRTGKGIAGVPVTDGYTFTVTDRNGVYQFVADEKCRNVYYTLPAEYKTALDPVTKLPLFYSTTPIDRSRQNRNDFVLEPLDAPEKDFTLVMIGDPQCKTDSDVHRFETETLPDLNRFMSESQAKGKYLNAYAVTLGDLTFDNTVQWGPMHKALSGFALESGDYLPIYNCVGNHDHDAACVDDYTATQTYVDLFGPTDYSFNRGDVHFVVMDDVAVTTTNGKTWKYADNISDRQLEWLKSDLALVKDKEEKMIVFCAHIQFRHNADKDNPDKIKNMAAAMDCLTDFHEAHVMIGHTHYAQNFIHHDYVTKGGTPVYEHIHGAACGAWWSCNLNLAGSPNGYSVYEVSGKTMKTGWRKVQASRLISRCVSMTATRSTAERKVILPVSMNIHGRKAASARKAPRRRVSPDSRVASWHPSGTATRTTGKSNSSRTGKRSETSNRFLPKSGMSAPSRSSTMTWDARRRHGHAARRSTIGT